MSAWQKRYRQLEQMSRQERETSFPVLLWLFIAGSLMGFVMEGVWHLLRTGQWGFRVGTLWGPFCVIYGAGAVVMYLISLRVRTRSPLAQFAAFALTGSAVELLSGVLQKRLFGTISWNYSHHALHLGSYISLRMTLLWGLCGMVLMYAALPMLLGAFNQLQLQRRRGLCRIAAVFMCLNLLMTSVALMRWQERVIAGTPASNAVEAYMDERWPDERLQTRFPNMIFAHTAEEPEP